MAENHKINFYPKPAPPTNPRVLPFAEIQRLLAKAPAPTNTRTRGCTKHMQHPTHNTTQKPQHIHIGLLMDPRKLPFNALIVGPTNSGKTQYLLNQLWGPFRGKFDYIVLFCPTFVKNKTYEGFVDHDPHIFVIVCQQHEIEAWLRVASYFFAGTNTLFILDDCAASKDVKGRTCQLVNLGFSARHDGISVWVLAQQITSIAKPYRENIAAIVLFYTPSSKTTKAIFEDYAGELTHEEYKGLIADLKRVKFSHLVFSLRYPYGIEYDW